MKNSNFSMKTVLVFAVYLIKHSLELDYSKIQVLILNYFKSINCFTYVICITYLTHIVLFIVDIIYIIYIYITQLSEPDIFIYY